MNREQTPCLAPGCRSPEIGKVVVFRALNLGDLLCAVPALRALRRGLPRAEITLLGLPWARSFAARFRRHLDRFVPFPGYPGLPEQSCAEHVVEAFFARMKEERYDLALQLHGSGEISNQVVGSLGARFIAGFCPAGRRAPDCGWYAPYPESLSEVDRNLLLVCFLGLPAGDRRLEFPLVPEDAEELDRFPALRALAPKSYVCIHPGASVRQKCWPVEKFIAVAKALREQGLTVVVTGNRQEADLAEEISSAIGDACVDAASPDLGLGGLALLISNARLLVCNDTGVSHLAAALRVPSVVVFTAADPIRWAPLDRERHRAVGGAGKMPTVTEAMNEVRSLFF